MKVYELIAIFRKEHKHIQTMELFENNTIINVYSGRQVLDKYKEYDVEEYSYYEKSGLLELDIVAPEGK